MAFIDVNVYWRNFSDSIKPGDTMFSIVIEEFPSFVQTRHMRCKYRFRVVVCLSTATALLQLNIITAVEWTYKCKQRPTFTSHSIKLCCCIIITITTVVAIQCSFRRLLLLLLFYSLFFTFIHSFFMLGFCSLFGTFIVTLININLRFLAGRAGEREIERDRDREIDRERRKKMWICALTWFKFIRNGAVKYREEETLAFAQFENSL